MRYAYARLRGKVSVLVAVCVLFLPTTGLTQNLDSQLKPLVDEIVAGCAQAGARRITVVDFADLQGQVTELGRFLAEEVSSSLVMAKPRLGVIDRANLRAILDEHKLNMSGLINPQTARRFGQIAGVDGIVIGTITPLGDSVRLTIKVIATETATVMAAARADIAKTKAIEDLLGRSVASSQGSGRAANSVSSGPRAAADGRGAQRSFTNRWVRLTVRSLHIDERGVPRLGLQVDNVTEEDFRLRCYPVKLTNDQGDVWDSSGRVEGLVLSNFLQGTLLSPGVPGVASIEFHYPRGQPPESHSFEVSGQCEVQVRGRMIPFPINVAAILPAY